MLKISVPATTANLGPGFDCLGMALTLYNNYYFEEIDSGLIIEGTDLEYCNENNLVYQSMKRMFNIVGYKYKGIYIKQETNIPISRGLGSSAACITAGVLAANELANAKLDKNELFQIACEIEGHPDNIAPAFFGGLTASTTINSKVYFKKAKIENNLTFFALIPDFKISTEKARAVLPNNIPYKDVVYNISQSVLTFLSLVEGDINLLSKSMDDKIHQPYRKSLINNYDTIVEKCINFGSISNFISGSGPTIIVIAEKDNKDFKNNMQQYLNTLNNNWNVLLLKTENNGAKIFR